MRLNENLENIKTKLDKKLKVDAAKELRQQGVTVLDSEYTLLDIPELIREIVKGQFQFRFNFKFIDAIGTIKGYSRGKSAGGLIVHPSMSFRILPRFNMQTLTPVRERASGVYGWPGSGLETNCVFPTIKHIKLNFKELTVQPDEFIAPEVEE